VPKDPPRDADKVISVHFPGKHAHNRAKLLLEALVSGVIFHGKGIALEAALHLQCLEGLDFRLEFNWCL
jgi:hypothetical protein